MKTEIKNNLGNWENIVISFLKVIKNHLYFEIYGAKIYNEDNGDDYNLELLELEKEYRKIIKIADNTIKAIKKENGKISIVYFYNDLIVVKDLLDNSDDETIGQYLNLENYKRFIKNIENANS